MSGNENLSKARRFWRSLASDETANPDPVNLTRDLSHLSSDQREQRKHALKTMLTANEARQKDALRARRPTMSFGQRVAILGGPFEGKQGIVLDADFIKNRAQLNIDNVPDRQWVFFKYIGSV